MSSSPESSRQAKEGNDNFPKQQKNKKSPLPLGWTKISRNGRKRKRVGYNENDVWFCCDDPSCQRDELHPYDDGTKDVKNEALHSPLKAEDFKSSKSSWITLRGKGIFCLHSLDCKWFQGHFLPSHNSKIAMGLLAVDRPDLDECLQCADGGYREVDLTVFSSCSDNSGGGGGVDAGKKRKQLELERVTCTGGDMLYMRSSSTKNVPQEASLSFEAEKIITGIKVEPIMTRYFSSLVGRLCRDDDREVDVGKTFKKSGSVLELLPDCAVVVGEMTMTVPRNFLRRKDKMSLCEVGDDGD